MSARAEEDDEEEEGAAVGLLKVYSGPASHSSISGRNSLARSLSRLVRSEKE